MLLTGEIYGLISITYWSYTYSHPHWLFVMRMVVGSLIGPFDPHMESFPSLSLEHGRVPHMVEFLQA